jgi:putative serine protease PepD
LPSQTEVAKVLGVHPQIPFGEKPVDTGMNVSFSLLQPVVGSVFEFYSCKVESVRLKAMRSHSGRRRGLIFRIVLLLLSEILLMPLQTMAFTSEELNTIAVYERVAPSVVNITTEICQPEFFFCSAPESGSGSGIVLRQDGIIITNYHVVDGAQNIQVTLGDGRRLKADVIGSAPGEDLAIIKVPVGDRLLKTIVMGNSELLQIGEKVLVIGNPFGLGQTLTVGTVSMVRRDIKSGRRILEDLIQTDASINPGNSGGALVNSSGELVGMSTIIISPTGSSIGLGFAIPSNRINKVVPGLSRTWEKWTGWILAVFLILWILRRIYRFR